MVETVDTKTALGSSYRKKDTFTRRWAAVFILLALFMGSWAGQFITQLQAEKQQAEQHFAEFSMSKFWPEFWSSTFENWQSEWLQLFTQAILIAAFSEYLFRKGDEEHYKTQLMIASVQQQLDTLSAKQSKRQV